MSKTVTYPHGGSYYLAFNIFFERLGYTVKLPPATSNSTLNKGVYHSPGQACLPFKYTLGNLLEGLESGEVDVVAMIGGKTGMCRLACYSTLYEKLIVDNKYDVEMFPFKLKKEMWQTIKLHFPNKSLPSFIKDFYAFWLGLNLVEQIREGALYYRPRAINTTEVDAIEKKLQEELSVLRSIKELRRFKKRVKSLYKTVKIDTAKEVIKIGMVGEFFLLIDQFSTMQMERFLGEQGVELESSLSFTHFFKGSIKPVKKLHNFLPTKTGKIWKLAKPYINRAIGGHGRESTGQAALYAKQGFDGVLQLYPFTCMPEIVASAILPKVSEDHGIPVLSLCFDEHTGAAGLQTRLEAFVDMIKIKKRTSESKVRED